MRKGLLLGMLLCSVMGCTPAEKPWAAVQAGAPLIDVRPAEYYYMGHVDGAINIPYRQLEAGADLPVAKDQKVVVYCQTGNTAWRAWHLLRARGYTNVIHGGTYKSLERSKPLPVLEAVPTPTPAAVQPAAKAPKP